MNQPAIRSPETMRRLSVPLEVKDLDEDGSFAGYASVFGVVDAYNEVVEPGAFKATLAKHQAEGTMPALLWQHNPYEPIGAWQDMHEDQHGLASEGQLVLSVQRASEARDLLKAKALRGLSIGFVPKKWEIDDSDEDGPRLIRLTEIDLWETSIVTFPANPAANIESVKADLAMRQDCTPAAMEHALREAFGMSRPQAKAFMAGGFGAAFGARDAMPTEAELAELAARADQVANILRN